jgi:tRNA nucleotidyltransferase (CCA-adding enzyme)
MDLPRDVSLLISRLEEAGFSAYAVGGCVRDSLMSKQPHDWDLCTSARPEEMLRVFRGEHVVETGLKHGTLAVVVNHVPYEITTFRVDGAYTDHRHPDTVSFVDNIAEDLSRRDFTVNAMAWSPDAGLVDLFGGRDDLAAGVIRCVGEPALRFDEKMIRILHALNPAPGHHFLKNGKYICTVAQEDGLALRLRRRPVDRIPAAAPVSVPGICHCVRKSVFKIVYSES